MGKASYVILRRGITLLASFVVIVILVAAVMELSGYAVSIYTAMVREAVNAEIMAIRARSPGLSESYLRELRENLTRYYEIQYGLRDELGNPIPPEVRMWRLVYMALTLNFGKTSRDIVANVVPTLAPAEVSGIIAAVLPRTILIVTLGELIVVAIALVVGPRIAYRHGSLADRAIVAYAAVSNAIPLWWLAMIFIQVFGYTLKLFPTSLRGVNVVLNNFWSSPGQNLIELLRYMAMPIMVFVVLMLGYWLYSIRAMVLRTVREDYVYAAKARGLPENVITRRYVLRPSLSPVITNIILALAGTLGGLIITESVFDWPGMGTLYYAAIVSADTQTIMALFVVFVGVYVVARFILEVIYVLIDPRVRLR